MKVTKSTATPIIGVRYEGADRCPIPVVYSLVTISRQFESMDEAMALGLEKDMDGTWTPTPETGSAFHDWNRKVTNATSWIKKAIKRSSGWPSKTFTVYVDTIPGYTGPAITVRN